MDKRKNILTEQQRIAQHFNWRILQLRGMLGSIKDRGSYNTIDEIELAIWKETEKAKHSIKKLICLNEIKRDSLINKKNQVNKTN